MISVPSTIIKDTKIDNSTKRLEKYLIENYSISDIVKSLAQIIIETDEQRQQPITITEDEMQTLLSMFRVKGQRMVNGVLVKETRGRKPLAYAK